MTRFLIIVISLMVVACLPVKAKQINESTQSLINRYYYGPDENLSGLREVQVNLQIAPDFEKELQTKRLQKLIEGMLKTAGIVSVDPLTIPREKSVPNLFISMNGTSSIKGYRYEYEMAIVEPARPVRDPSKTIFSVSYSRRAAGDAAINGLEVIVFEQVHEFLKDWALANVSRPNGKTDTKTP